MSSVSEKSVSEKSEQPKNEVIKIDDLDVEELLEKGHRQGHQYDRPAPPKSNVDEIGKETLSEKILKGIKNLNVVRIEITMKGNKHFKFKADRKGILVDTTLSLQRLIGWTIFIGGSIVGMIKLIA